VNPQRCEAISRKQRLIGRYGQLVLACAGRRNGVPGGRSAGDEEDTVDHLGRAQGLSGSECSRMNMKGRDVTADTEGSRIFSETRRGPDPGVVRR